MRIGLGQINTTVGDLSGNAARIIEYAKRAADAGCGLFVTPELATTGYPPQDLLFKRHFIADQLALLYGGLAQELPLPSLVGFVDRGPEGELYNAAALVSGGEVARVIHKTLLPTYDVFDEWRYFRPADEIAPVEFAGKKIGVTICEDIWDGDYDRKIVQELARAGAKTVVNLSSSPFHAGKREERLGLLRMHAIANEVSMVYCNLVGAQDELIFDGESMAVDSKGRLVALGPQFEEALVVVETGNSGSEPPKEAPHRAFDFESEVFHALCLGIRDYFRKCGFERAVIGLSGGIDSALTACLAAEALGSGDVIGVYMPSRHSAAMSGEDAEALAHSLGIEYLVMPIDESVEIAKSRFVSVCGEYRDPVTVENLQARERGKILMEISNDRRALVLATGNKTEYALGYSTLYGDMCGGLAVIGDVSKPEVYALARWYNKTKGAEIIPERTLTRPPSAELRDGQVDPFDYARISPLADAVVEEHLSPDELIARGFAREEIALVFRLVRGSEYKRRQAAPVLRITRKAFGIGRKMPIVNRYGG
ncbi:MAG: NAD+ synthase [bacterium]